ncbi:MAG TPA: sensor domain-containing diguanylate cyclase [Candidatus Polarisedimenticolia bacterium]|nr:sensor domain-containing diguanylate cyclase [Candidatus Polarisedimenticolia bacterium]
MSETIAFLQGNAAWGGTVVGLVVGALLIMLWRGRTAPGRPAPAARAERGDPAASVLRDLQRTVARLESDNAALSDFMQLLPEFTRRMNSRIERREIPMQMVRIVEQLFAPSQILIFLLEERINKMALVKEVGLPGDAARQVQFDFGEGRLGWVAQNGIAMDLDDFIREKRLTGANFDVPGHFQFSVELCAPMIHEGKVRGVISAGGIKRHYKLEKSILSLIADLGSIALYNHDLFNKTQEMANCDGLTKLFNKRYFMERLSNVLLEASKGHRPFSLFIFDLDHFKHYNDTQGHQAGDEVLKATGEILRDTVRPDDLACRFGGEEFIVLLAHAPKRGALLAAERIREKIAAHPFAARESQPLKVVSLSGGVATFPDDGLTSADLIAAADAALYRAKKEGRNRVLPSEPKYFSDESDDIVYHPQSG